ncbi:MAG: leucyl/phenylalanyl-tRNA--protein transferase [Prevotella sp.]|nr:leucyl/phenylalanyl-tRNA--protein transferase [Prevotella sp.]
MAVFRLDEELWFPDPHLGEPSGLVAVGGDLSADRLLLAYSNGFFPWYSFRDWDEPHWYCPLDRYVIFPNEIHISHSMRQLLRFDKYEVTINKDFLGVIRGCATVQGRNEEEGAWLGPDIINAYTELNRQGFATSVEVWEQERLVGGLYGVCLRRAFFGESMFSLVPNASKLALICLALRMETIGGHFIDCQFETPHFASMGGRHITYEQYMRILDSGNQDHKSI